MSKKMVLVPNMSVKTWIEVDENLKGKELEDYFQKFKDKVSNIDIDNFTIKKNEIVGNKGMRNKELK